MVSDMGPLWGAPPGTPHDATSGARPRRLRGKDELGEGRVVRGRDLGEGLAVEGDSRALEPRHELGVGRLVASRRRVDADDPETTEIALLPLAAHVGEVACAVHRLLGELVELALPEEVAFRL